MKKLVSLMILSGLCMAQADAVTLPNWKRPIKTAKMGVTELERPGDSDNTRFPNIEQATLTLTHEDGTKTSDPTGITFEYQVTDSETNPGLLAARETSPSDEHAPIRMSFHLVITHKEKDICGAVHFYASLPPGGEETGLDETASSPVIRIHLIDRSTQICKLNSLQPWEAIVEEGHKTTGEIDTTLTLGGTPKSVLTIESL